MKFKSLYDKDVVYRQAVIQQKHQNHGQAFGTSWCSLLKKPRDEFHKTSDMPRIPRQDNAWC